jgi:hypothetical protein
MARMSTVVRRSTLICCTGPLTALARMHAVPEDCRRELLLKWRYLEAAVLLANAIVVASKAALHDCDCDTHAKLGWRRPCVQAFSRSGKQDEENVNSSVHRGKTSRALPHSG